MTLEKSINDLKNNSDKYYSYNEANTKSAVIERILFDLNWNTYDANEVHHEDSTGKGPVDYSLRLGGKTKIFIEAKRVNENLEKHEEQLLNYCFGKSVDLAILTNGFSWWFYLPLHTEVIWQERKFCSIEIKKQETEDIVNNFEKLLEKENVGPDKSLNNARNIFNEKKRKAITKTKIPEAWVNLLNKPNEKLIDLLSNLVNEISGYAPDEIDVIEFLNNQIKTPSQNLNISIENKQLKQMQNNHYSEEKEINCEYGGNVTNTEPVLCIFRNEKFSPDTWRGLYVELLNKIYSENPNIFDKKIFKLNTGKRNSHISYNISDFKSHQTPVVIKNSDIYVDNHFSAKDMFKKIKNLLNLFDYSLKDVIIRIKPK